MVGQGACDAFETFFELACNDSFAFHVVFCLPGFVFWTYVYGVGICGFIRFDKILFMFLDQPDFSRYQNLAISSDFFLPFSEGNQPFQIRREYLLAYM